MYACLAVTCHLHFWQNDRDFLRATVVTRGWNGYRNKSQHRKSTLEKKILPPFQQGFTNPRPFNHESGALTTELSPPPLLSIIIDRFYIALFSALEQTHLCSHVILHEWIAFYSACFEYPTKSVVYLQRWHGWCHNWETAAISARSVPHTTMHHVTSRKATYVRCMRV